jgi:hypothetical protein
VASAIGPLPKKQPPLQQLNKNGSQSDPSGTHTGGAAVVVTVTIEVNVYTGVGAVVVIRVVLVGIFRHLHAEVSSGPTYACKTGGTGTASRLRAPFSMTVTVAVVVTKLVAGVTTLVTVAVPMLR